MQDIKQAFQSAKKELDEEVKRKLIEDMKGYIQNTLQAIEDKKSNIAESQQELKALKADLDDLKEGRLDRIKERQDKDPVSRRVSVIIITKIINNYPSIQPFFQPFWGGTSHTAMGSLTTSGTGNMLGQVVASNAYSSNDVSGTYTVTNSGGYTKAFYLTGNSQLPR